MPENQVPQKQASESILSAPPGLQLIGADAGDVCVDGYCVLPRTATPRPSVDAGTADDEPGARASGSHAG